MWKVKLTGNTIRCEANERERPFSMGIINKAHSILSTSEYLFCSFAFRCSCKRTEFNWWAEVTAKGWVDERRMCFVFEKSKKRIFSNKSDIIENENKSVGKNVKNLTRNKNRMIYWKLWNAELRKRKRNANTQIQHFDFYCVGWDTYHC